MNIQERLFELQDKEYATFTAGLAPTVNEDTIIGVRIPLLRKLAKELKDTKDAQDFMDALPHQYHDENLLHSILLCQMKPLDKCLVEVEKFLPYVDNWAVCDTLRPKVLAKHKELMPRIETWIRSDETYTCRFGIDVLQTFYLDDDFEVSQAELVASVRSDEYYVNMMIAWYFATALAKQWDAVIPFLLENRLSIWTHNKTIQKARESFRITPEQKAFLNTLKRKA